MPALSELDSRTVRLKGLRETQAAFARADKKLVRDMRGKLRDAAKPVAATAESLARSKIRNIGERWPTMRVGVTRTLVYVAPKERGVRTKGNQRLRRPKFATRLMDDAMSPALDRHQGEVVNAVGRLLDEVGRDWER